MKQILQQFLLSMATFWGIGKIPKAPGTWGSLAAIPVVFLLMKLGPILYMILTFVFIILAIIAADIFERQSMQHDSKEIVIDEVVGMLVAMTWLPQTGQAYLAGFFLFRFFDILKPFPISYFDRKVTGGFGVVIDDVVAGMLTNFILQFVLLYTPWLGAI